MRLIRPLFFSICLVALALTLAPGALALPTLSVSSPTTVPNNSSFSVDILISDVDAGSPLNAFELDLFFDGGILSATSVIGGGFLLAPTFQVQNNVGLISVEFAEVTLLPFGASGAGVLATIFFDATHSGVSDLDLANVVLAAPFGVPIQIAEVRDGSVHVIPEPSGLLLSAIGLSIVAFRVRGERR